LKYSFSYLQHIASIVESFFRWRFDVPWEAEAWALLLGAKLTISLNLQGPIFLTDNETLAIAVNRRTIIHDLGHWTLRPILTEFTCVIENLHHSVIKIGRATNKVADNLTKKARQAMIPNSCYFSCESLVHSRNCIIQSNLENFQWGSFCPICVLCLWVMKILPFQKKLIKEWIEQTPRAYLHVSFGYGQYHTIHNNNTTLRNYCAWHDLVANITPRERGQDGTWPCNFEAASSGMTFQYGQIKPLHGAHRHMHRWWWQGIAMWSLDQP
jgi:hypothetical protein